MKRPYILSCILLTATLLPASAVAIDYFPIINVNYDTAQSLAMEVGVVMGPEEGEGLALSVEPGLTGTKYHVGYEQIVAAAVGAIAAYRISWTELQMYGNHNRFVAGSHYSGIEFTYISTPTLIQIGYFQNNVTQEGLFMVGFGMGL